MLWRRRHWQPALQANDSKNNKRTRNNLNYSKNRIQKHTVWGYLWTWFGCEGNRKPFFIKYGTGQCCGSTSDDVTLGSGYT